MQEILDNMQKKITALQTASNTVRQVTVNPVIPLSLFVPNPDVMDAIFIPAGKITQVIVQLFDSKEGVLFVDIILGDRTITERFPVKIAQIVRNISIDIPAWATIRAKLECVDPLSHIVIGIIFNPIGTYVAKETIELISEEVVTIEPITIEVLKKEKVVEVKEDA